MNTYGYVGGNPLGYVDPKGLFLVATPPAMTAIEGFITTIGGAVIINEMFNSTGSVTDNIADMPAANDDQMCSKPKEDGDDDDFCSKMRKTLQTLLRQIMIAKNSGIHYDVSEYNRSARMFNLLCSSSGGSNLPNNNNPLFPIF